MTEQKFELGQRVVIRVCHVGIKSHEGQRGEIVRDWHDGSFTIRKEDGDFCVADKIELIEPAEPKRYTGELIKGMRVMIVREDGEKHEATVKTEIDEDSQYAIESDNYLYYFSKEHGGWVEVDDDGYISHVISKPEQETTPSMHVNPDGFAVPNLQPTHHHDDVTIKNSPRKGVITKIMDTMFDLYLANFDKNSLRFKKYALREDGRVKAEVLFGALVTWNTKTTPKFIDQLNNHLAEIEKREKEAAKR